MGYAGFDDEWILAHWKEYKRWCDMFDDYKRSHPADTHNINNFRSHMSMDLKINRRYTSEQDEWLRENYPHLGAEEAYRQFQEIFGIKKGFHGFKTHITDLGLKVTDERWREACQNNGYRERLPVGTITKRGRNDEWILTEDGWRMLCHVIVGDVPKGCNVIHLDGDTMHNTPGNIAVISRTTVGLMPGNGFWSSDAEITKTALVWCKLHDELKRSESKWQKQVL